MRNRWPAFSAAFVGVPLPFAPQSFDAKKEVTCVTFDRGENRVAVGTSAGTIKVWELETAKRESRASVHGGIHEWLSVRVGA